MQSNPKANPRSSHERLADESRKRFSRKKHVWKRKCREACEAAEELIEMKKKKGRVLRVKVMRLGRRVYELGEQGNGLFDEAQQLRFDRLSDVQEDIWYQCEELAEFSGWIRLLAESRGVKTEEFPTFFTSGKLRHDGGKTGE